MQKQKSGNNIWGLLFRQISPDKVCLSVQVGSYVSYKGNSPSASFSLAVVPPASVAGRQWEDKDTDRDQ